MTKLKEAIIACVLIVLGVFFVIWLTGHLGLWMNGMNHVVDRATISHAHAFDGTYSVDIDLNDLARNEGKVVLNKDGYQIVVSEVITSGNSDYEVMFRSIGRYSLSDASLVSGLIHTETADVKMGTESMSAVAEGTYRGETFPLTESQIAGIIHKNGDEFGFYLFPPDVDVEIDLEEDSIITISLSNLAINYWMYIR